MTTSSTDRRPVALVAGASRGSGAAAAVRLVERGHDG
jgi:NAD(P)-dependent dehydrogenase (short-subunit alcohol dehydrogenase family)